MDYIEAAKITEGPLFRTAFRRTKQLTTKAMSGIDICRMMKRRLKAAGLPGQFSPHSFRVATETVQRELKTILLRARCQRPIFGVEMASCGSSIESHLPGRGYLSHGSEFALRSYAHQRNSGRAGTRNAFERLRITETHPKVLYFALTQSVYDFVQRRDQMVQNLVDWAP